VLGGVKLLDTWEPRTVAAPEQVLRATRGLQGKLCGPRVAEALQATRGLQRKPCGPRVGSRESPADHAWAAEKALRTAPKPRGAGEWAARLSLLPTRGQQGSPPKPRCFWGFIFREALHAGRQSEVLSVLGVSDAALVPAPAPASKPRAALGHSAGSGLGEKKSGPHPRPRQCDFLCSHDLLGISHSAVLALSPPGMPTEQASVACVAFRRHTARPIAPPPCTPLVSACRRVGRIVRVMTDIFCVDHGSLRMCSKRSQMRGDPREIKWAAWTKHANNGAIVDCEPRKRERRQVEV
jgi:hypothetical protein